MNQNTRVQLSSAAKDDSNTVIDQHPMPGNPQQEPHWPDRRMASMPLLDIRAGRAALLAYFENTWRLTETLFSALVSEEVYYVRPYHKTRHPFIFYYAHPVTFYVNKLLIAGLIKQPLNPHFEILFETGVDEMSWDDLSKNDMAWPCVSECRAYRRRVYALVVGIIESAAARARLRSLCGKSSTF